VVGSLMFLAMTMVTMQSWPFVGVGVLIRFGAVNDYVFVKKEK